MDYANKIIEAANFGNLQKLTKLLDSGGSVDVQDDEGISPLHIASSNGFHDGVLLLLSKNASVDLTNIYGWTPLMLAARYGHLSIMHLLLKHHAKVNISNRIGLTPITAAVFSGQVSAVKLLLDAGAITNYIPLNSPSECNVTPLMVAALLGHDSIVNLLIEKGVFIDCFLNTIGWTPLMLASCCGQESIAKSLIANGADKTKLNISGKSAVDIAGSTSQMEIKFYLESLQSSKSVNVQRIQKKKFLRAVHKGNLNEVKSTLVAEPSYVNAQDPSDGVSALMVASMQGHIDIVKSFIQNKVDINVQDLVDGWTALIYAVFHGHAAIVKLLLNYGADVHIRTNNGYTVLDLVKYIERNDTIFEVLMAKAASTSLNFSKSDSFISSAMLPMFSQKKDFSFGLRSRKLSLTSSPSGRMKGLLDSVGNKFHTMFTKSSPRSSSSSLVSVSITKPATPESDDVFSTPLKNTKITQAKLSLSALKSPNRFLANNLKQQQIDPITPPFSNYSTPIDEFDMELFQQDKTSKNQVVSLYTPHLLRNHEMKVNRPIKKTQNNLSRNLFCTHTEEETKEYPISRQNISKNSFLFANQCKIIKSSPPSQQDTNSNSDEKINKKDISLSQLLEQKSLKEHISKFKEQEIDMDAFKCMNKEDFIEIGIDNTASREALYEILNNLKRTTDV